MAAVVSVRLNKCLSLWSLFLARRLFHASRRYRYGDDKEPASLSAASLTAASAASVLDSVLVQAAEASELQPRKSSLLRLSFNNSAIWKPTVTPSAETLAVTRRSLIEHFQLTSHVKEFNDAVALRGMPRSNGQSERLAVLGDSILGFLTLDDLTHELPKASEEQLSLLKSRYVCNEALALYAESIGLTLILAVSVADGMIGVSDSRVGTVVEALLATVYLCHGNLDHCREIVRRVVAFADENDLTMNWEDRMQRKLELRMGDRLSLQIPSPVAPAQPREPFVSTTVTASPFTDTAAPTTAASARPMIDAAAGAPQPTPGFSWATFSSAPSASASTSSSSASSGSASTSSSSAPSAVAVAVPDAATTSTMSSGSSGFPVTGMPVLTVAQARSQLADKLCVLPDTAAEQMLYELCKRLSLPYPSVDTTTGKNGMFDCLGLMHVISSDGQVQSLYSRVSSVTAIKAKEAAAEGLLPLVAPHVLKRINEIEVVRQKLISVCNALRLGVPTLDYHIVDELWQYKITVSGALIGGKMHVTARSTSKRTAAIHAARTLLMRLMKLPTLEQWPSAKRRTLDGKRRPESDQYASFWLV